MAVKRIKPTLQTKFHIDYDWWERDERDLRVYLLSHLSNEQQMFFQQNQNTEEIDWIDPQTAEVRRVDALTMALHEAANSESFITEQTSLVDAVFRVFIRNNNIPMTPEELAEETGRQASMILRTLSGTRVYKGIRPMVD